MGAAMSTPASTPFLEEFTSTEPISLDSPLWASARSGFVFPSEFLANDCTSNNTARLLFITSRELNALPRGFNLAYPYLSQLIAMSRDVFLHLVGKLTPDQVVSHLTSSTAELPGNILSVYTHALIDALIDIPVSGATYGIVIEILCALLAAMTTQVYAPLDFDSDQQSIKIILNHPRIEQLLTTLLGLFVMDVVPNGSSSFHEENHSLLSRILAISSRVISLPLDLVAYLFPPKSQEVFLGMYSIHMFLILVHQPCDGSEVDSYTPFRRALADLIDDDMVNTSNNPHIPFQVLYNAIVQVPLKQEWPLLLMFTLITENTLFCDYLLSKSDLHHYIVEILYHFYNEKDSSSNFSYIMISFLLRLSQDETFAKNAHSLVRVPNVSLPPDIYFNEVSLGSLMTIIIIRKLQSNLSSVQDSFYHSSALAILCNMAPFADKMHCTAAQAIVGILSSLSHRYRYLTKAPVNVNISPQDSANELETFGEFISIVLEITMYSIDQDVSNIDLLYCLVREREILQPFKSDSQLWELAQPISTVLDFLNTRILELGNASSVHAVRKCIADSLQTIPERHMTTQTSKFEYLPIPDAHHFYLPYLWKLAYLQSVDLKLDTANICMFTPPGRITIQGVQEQV